MKFLWSIAVILGLTLASVAAAAAVIAVLPADHFVARRRARPQSAAQWARLIIRNVGGLGFIALGTFLALPGVPGQGLLLILVGLALTDVPGKRPIERALMRRPAIHHALNALRTRMGRDPFVVPPDDPVV